MEINVISGALYTQDGKKIADVKDSSIMLVDELYKQRTMEVAENIGKTHSITCQLLRILEEYPVNGRKTNTGTIKMIRKEIGNMTFRIARKCNVSVNYPKWSIQGKKVVLGEPSILLPTLRYVSFEELKAIELGYEGGA